MPPVDPRLYKYMKNNKKKRTSEDRDYEGKPNDPDEYMSRTSYDSSSIESHIDEERSTHGIKSTKIINRGSNNHRNTLRLSTFEMLMVKLGIARIKQDG